MLTWNSPHPTAIDWQHRATANGGSTHNLHRDSADRLCKALDSTGLTSRMIEVYAFLGDNVPAVCTKLFYSAVGSSPYMTAQNWATVNILDFGGLRDAANTSKYLNTNMTTAIALSGNESNTGLHWYTRNTAASGTTQVIFAVAGASAVVLFGGWLSTGSKESGGIATASSSALGTTTSSVGFQGALNRNVRSTQYFLNGSALGAMSAVSSGTWTAPNKLLMFSNSASAWWKRDALYGDVTVGITTEDELRLFQSVRAFQQFLNRV